MRRRPPRRPRNRPAAVRRGRALRIAWVLGTAQALVAAGAPAATWVVPRDAPTIQAGIDAAQAGDTVLVEPGTYTGLGNRDIKFKGKDLVVRSVGGAAVTIVDVGASADSAHRGFEFADTETRAAVLDGFTILNGFMATPVGPTLASGAHDLSGAGIMVRLGSSPTVRNCVIRDCFSEFTGGGIGVELTSAPLFEDVIVERCTAGIQGGGVTVELTAEPEFVRCIVKGCRSPLGGGMHFGARAQLTECLVAGNAASGRGGGLDVVFPARVDLVRTIVANNCSADGADVFVDPASLGVGFDCSAYDPQAVADTGNRVELISASVTVDPLFCAPAPCAAAPTTEGDYTLRFDSPCLAANSPCGMRIGPLDGSCQTAIERLPWSTLKQRYR